MLRTHWIKAYGSILGLFAVIILMALMFHHPIRTIDAISCEPVPGFDIKISARRIIFEPFTGPLLFYLHADQPFLEFAILLIWTISLLLVIPVITTLLQRDSSPRVKLNIHSWHG